MKTKLNSKVLLVAVLYVLFFIPLFLLLYTPYLRRPDVDTWNKIDKYLSGVEICKSSTLVFEPEWLRNYATDFGKLSEFSISKRSNNLSSFCLISMKNGGAIPNGYRLLEDKNNIGAIWISMLSKD
ncbi:hypothetical protein KKF55_04640 [Patescibacteria group bacterium]|nr:hypothetical protein [Patescibacteria group bacterium]